MDTINRRCWRLYVMLGLNTINGNDKNCQSGSKLMCLRGNENENG